MRKKKDSKPLSPTPVKLELALKKRLEKLSKTKERSVHWLMKKAIEHYVSHEEEAEKLKQETIKRWQEAEQGRVFSNDSVTAWLKTWGTDEEDDRPT